MTTYNENESKLYGSNITGDIKDPKSSYYHFEMSVRKLIADYFTRTGEKLETDSLKSFAPVDRSSIGNFRTVYIYGNDKIYAFSIKDDLKKSANVEIYDLTKLGHLELKYEYDEMIQDNEKTFGFSLKQPYVYAIHLHFETEQFLAISQNAFNKHLMDDIAEYILKYNK